MSIVKSIGDFFRSASKDSAISIDRYDILSPLMSIQEYAEKTLDILNILKSDSAVVELLTGKVESKVTAVENAIKAHHEYIKGLDSSLRKDESNNPFSTMISGLSSIITNLGHVESHFPELFGGNSGEISEDDIRSSSLVIIGYTEVSSEFCTWISALIRHLTLETKELIPPFETKALLLKAETFGDFIAFNLKRWNGAHEGILDTIKQMQKKGADVTVKAGDQWIDSFMHDAQFTPVEKELMTAAFRSPVLWIATKSVQYHQYKIELLSTRKDWLIAKTALESEKLRGLNPDTPEYKKLKSVVDKYADLASKYEQKLERARA